jgi:hypothetical protein
VHLHKLLLLVCNKNLIGSYRAAARISRKAESAAQSTHVIDLTAQDRMLLVQVKRHFQSGGFML